MRDGPTNDRFMTDMLSYVRARLDTRAAACAGRDLAVIAAAGERQARLGARVDGAPDPLAPFALTTFERDAVWLLIASELDREVERLAHAVAPNDGLGATTSRIARVCSATGRSAGFRALGLHGTLRRLALIERSDGGDANLHESRQTWAISRRILAWLHGDTELAPELVRFARRTDDAGSLGELAVPEHVIAEARAAMQSPRAVVMAAGAPGLGRRSVLVAAAREAGIDVLEVDCARLAREPAALAMQLRLIARECKLLATTPLLRGVDALVEDPDGNRLDLVGSELAGELDTSIFVTCSPRRVPLRWERPVIAFAVTAPSSSQRAGLWCRLISDASADDGEHLATRYPLAPALMHRAALATKARANGRRVVPADIAAGVRAVLDDRLGNFAARVEVAQTWADLVLPDDQRRPVAELIARIRQRRTVYERWGFAAKIGKGLGVSALFSGPPGTGKTMVAALIARELELELYQVDTGKLVSKWIGETEKHLGELFDAAEAGHAILLFDEADALFGKRTDVRSSNDRYANLETGYLLQRLESFTGICMLTSNHEASIDPAFQRRLSLHLRFQLPEVDERERLWRAMLPPAAPVAADADFASLARRFEMSGGYIRNAVLRAAFLAADEGVRISRAHLERAADLEYEGLGKLAAAPTLRAWSSP